MRQQSEKACSSSGFDSPLQHCSLCGGIPLTLSAPCPCSLDPGSYDAPLRMIHTPGRNASSSATDRPLSMEALLLITVPPPYGPRPYGPGPPLILEAP